jgi:F-type H+-transporting ATPase subunit alpha
LEDVEVTKIGQFEAALLSFMAAEYEDTMKTIVNSGDWNKDLEAKFKEAVEKFKATQTY